MRVKAHERREMNRRLKDRVPAALMAGLRQLPTMILVVSAAIEISPEALARVQSGEVTTHFVVEGTKTAPAPDLVTKTYTKEELSKTLPPNPGPPGLDARIASEVKELFTRVTARQHEGIPGDTLNSLKTAQPDDDTMRTQLAALKDAPKAPKTNVRGLWGYLGLEIQKSGTVQAKARFQIVRDLAKKFDLNLDFGKFTKVFKKDEPVAPQSGTVRYGLVLEDIKYQGDAPKRVSVNDNQDEMQFAGHADVQWTIGPLTEEQGRRLFAIREGEEARAADPTLVERVEANIPHPRGEFVTRVTPEGFDNLSTVDKTEPIWRVEINQVDGMYKHIARFDQHGKAINGEHAFQVPVAGTMQYGRRFNDKWELIETSALNILFDKSLPSVSVHHLHLAQRISADISHTFEGGHAVTLTGRSEATGKTEFIEGGDEKRPEHYEISYNKSF